MGFGDLQSALGERKTFGAGMIWEFMSVVIRFRLRRVPLSLIEYLARAVVMTSVIHTIRARRNDETFQNDRFDDSYLTPVTMYSSTSNDPLNLAPPTQSLIGF